jgi:hypothetical protein
MDGQHAAQKECGNVWSLTPLGAQNNKAGSASLRSPKRFPTNDHPANGFEKLLGFFDACPIRELLETR